MKVDLPLPLLPTIKYFCPAVILRLSESIIFFSLKETLTSFNSILEKGAMTLSFSKVIASSPVSFSIESDTFFPPIHWENRSEKL